MKNQLKALFAVIALATGLPASAAVVNTVYVNNFMTFFESQNVTHNVPGGPFYSGVLTLVLRDDAVDGAESFFSIGLGHIASGAANTTYNLNLGVLGLAQLNFFNTYSYSLINTGGDFWFDRSILTLKVPEPGSLMLLGVGLIGMAMARRRRQRI